MPPLLYTSFQFIIYCSVWGVFCRGSVCPGVCCFIPRVAVAILHDIGSHLLGLLPMFQAGLDLVAGSSSSPPVLSM
jgi:hypothetical protein